MEKRRNNKKGFFTDPIEFSIAFLILIMIFMIFTFVFHIIASDSKFEITSSSSSLDAQRQLVSLLSLPVNVATIDTDYAGYIALAAYNDTIMNNLEVDLNMEISRIIAVTSAKHVKLEITHYISGSKNFKSFDPTGNTNHYLMQAGLTTMNPFIASARIAGVEPGDNIDVVLYVCTSSERCF